LTHFARRGYTLVEIMIVVIIFGILLAIAALNWNTSRSISRAQAVVSNLSEIYSAKETFMYNNALVPGNPVNNATDLTPNYLKEWPKGPVTGTYLANPIGSNPTFLGEPAPWFTQHCTGKTADSACPL